MERLGPSVDRLMRISINGEAADTKGAKTVDDLIEHYKIPPQSILIEHNGTALHRREWAQRPLSEGDRVEIVRVVAGG